MEKSQLSRIEDLVKNREIVQFLCTLPFRVRPLRASEVRAAKKWTSPPTNALIGGLNDVIRPPPPIRK